MRLFVTRHGETDWNSKHMVCGISDVSLSEAGKEQAKKLAEILEKNKESNNIHNIFVSPLKRALETASPIEKALNIKATIVDNLHEVNFGIYEGADWYDPGFQVIKYEPFMRFPNGETIVTAAQRVYNFLDSIKTTYSDNSLIVCHGTIMRLIDTYFNSYSLEEYRSIHPGNCELKEYMLN